MICERCNSLMNEINQTLENVRKIYNLLGIPEYLNCMSRSILETSIVIAYNCFVCPNCNFTHLIKKPEFSNKSVDEIFDYVYEHKILGEYDNIQ